MERQRKYNWLSKEDFLIKNPRPFTIVGLVIDGEDELILIDPGDGVRKWSLSNKLNNLLLDTFGSDDEKWIGQTIVIEQSKNSQGELRRIPVGVQKQLHA